MLLFVYILFTLTTLRSNDVDALNHLLISAVVDINTLDNEGRTPLYAAVGADAVDVVDVCFILLLIFFYVYCTHNVEYNFKWYAQH